MQDSESVRRKRVCVGISFVIFVGLFCRICWSLLSCLLVSFVVYVGLFCHWRISRVWMQDSESVRRKENVQVYILSYLLVSFVVYVGLFCNVCWSLLS